jgi:membrane protease YdiL (CAAX protease family)
MPEHSNSDDRSTAALLVAAIVTALALVYGNAVNLLPEDPRDDVKLYANLAMTAIAIGGALAAGFSVRKLGLTITWRGALTGVAIGLTLAAPVVLFVLIAPFFTGNTIGSEETRHMSAAEVAWRAGVRILVGTAIPEEVLFRGLLYALWHRAGGVRAAVSATAISFGLWHAVISFGAVSGIDVLNGPLIGLVYTLNLVGLAAGGIMFAVLRWRSASIAAPVIVHWLFNGLGVVATWLRG